MGPPKPSRVGPPPDHLLADGQFAEINRAFFSEPGPAAYFDIRLRLLSSAADAAAQSLPLVQRIALGSAVFADAEVEVPSGFVAAEATSIFHHAVETMWRLFLSQEPPAQCPRLEMARLHVPDMKDRMTTYLEQDSAERRQRLRAVLAPQEQAVLDPSEEPELQRRLEGTDRLFVGAAEAWLRDGFIYNATKHGLAVGVKRQRVSLGLGEHDEHALSHAGVYLSALDRGQSAARQKWVEVEVLVEPDRIVWATGVCVAVMRSLWQVGQARFVDGRAVRLSLPSVEDVKVFTELQHGRIARVRKDLLYEDKTGRLMTLSIG